MPFGVTVYDPAGQPQGGGLNSSLMGGLRPAVQQPANQPFAALDDSTYEGSLAASSASQPPGVSIPRQNPNVLGQGGAFNPTYLDYGGYNPLQYATDGMTSALAQYMGAGTAQTNVAGPVAPPSQNLLAFGNGSNGNGGALLNAGLVGNELERFLGEYNDPNVALQVFNQRRAAELAMAGTGYTPVTETPVYNPAPASQAQGPGGSWSTGPNGPTWNPMTPPAGSTGKPKVDDQLFRFQPMPLNWNDSATIPDPTTPNTIASLTSPIPPQPAAPPPPTPPAAPSLSGGRPAFAGLLGGSPLNSGLMSLPLSPPSPAASPSTPPAANPPANPTPTPGGTNPPAVPPVAAPPIAAPPALAPRPSPGVSPLNPSLQAPQPPANPTPQPPTPTTPTAPAPPPLSPNAPLDIGQILALFQNMSQPPQNQSFQQVDQFLADATNDVGYLRGIAENSGYSTINGPGMAAAQRTLNEWSGANGQTPAWMTMMNDSEDIRNLRSMASGNGMNAATSQTGAAALQTLNGFGQDNPAWRSMLTGGADAQALRSLRDSGGSPVDRTAAWQAAVAASQRNLDRGAADLNERLSVSGNRFSTAFGDAMGDYWNQARLGQNAQLLDAQANALEAAAGRQYGAAGSLSALESNNAQFMGGQDLQRRSLAASLGMDAANQSAGRQLNAGNTLASLSQQSGATVGAQDLQRRMALSSLGINAEEAARGREMTAAQFLAGQGFNSANQLSAQDFASRQQQQQQAFAAAQQLAGGSDSAANLLAQLGVTGAQTLNQNSMTGAQNLFNAENQAALQQLQNQMQMLPMLTQYDTALRALGLQGSNQLSQNWMASLGLGSQLGQQQFGTDAFNLDRVFQEWLRQQPEQNPMLPYIAGAATSQPTMYQPQYRPPGISGYLNAAGGIMGGLGALGLSI
jgi:hypothetical protein